MSAQPSVVKTVDINYAGEKRTLVFGLLAFKDLGINPFDPETVAHFSGKRIDLPLAASLIRAGLLHDYYGKKATRRGEEPPSMDDVLADMAEIGEFIAAFQSVAKLFDEPKGEASDPADPLSA